MLRPKSICVCKGGTGTDILTREQSKNTRAYLLEMHYVCSNGRTTREAAMIYKKYDVIWWRQFDEVTLSWWHHQMETFSAVLVLCEGNPPVIGGFTSQMASYTEMFPFDDVIMETSINTKVSGRWVIEVDNRVSATCVQIRSVNTHKHISPYK